MTRDSRRKGLLGIAAVVLGLCLGSSPASAQENTLQKIVRTKKFNIGYVLHTPSAMKDPRSGELTGFHFDAARWICDQMKVDCVFHEVTWATFVAGLQGGKYDLSVAGSFTTMARAMAVAFTDPIYYKGAGE